MLNSFKNSYKAIRDYDVDGIAIDPIEYEFLNLTPDQFNETGGSSSSALIYDDDLDGEPI